MIVGTGIKFVSHLTTEAKAYIQKSEKVLYLVNEPAMEEWIKQNNPHAESLYNLYITHSKRLICYKAITDHIVNEVSKKQHVCVVLYGHPTVFAKPALDAAIQVRNAGYDTRILPGISAEDCLFADLMIDPGSCGCQSFEATDFLIRKKQFDTSCHLVLWQVGIIGMLEHPTMHDNTHGATLLLEQLTRYYPENHEIVLYEASQYPHFSPKITYLPLSELKNAPFSVISTLYIPPVGKANLDLEMLTMLNIGLESLS